MNATHDPKRRSWVDSANRPGTDFPIQNLPFGVFWHGVDARVGVAIGDRILDLRACGIESGASLNNLMARGRQHWSALRARVSELLSEGSPRHPEWLVPMAEAEMLLPAAIGDYTDFYASLYHATNVGRLFRPENPLLPNYKHVPIAYHGRASSVVVSGTPVRRPRGQTEGPVFGPSKALDYELELGFYVGPGNRLGEPIPIAEAEDHIFGLCLVNDWSARDIQKWEYQPLGPFLGKSFATTVSPWVVTMEAMEPFRAPAFARAEGDPAPLPYLRAEGGGVDVVLEVYVNSALRSRGNARDLYWTLAQMLTHHTSNGCNLRPGDLIASGTISGAASGARGCLLEMGGPFLEDGDEVLFRAYAEREAFARIGFGECRGVVAG